MTQTPTYTVLTIEDEAIIRQNIAAYLEDSNYRVLQAENGRTGLDLFRAEKPDVVLVDLRMPEVDGFKILTVVTRESPETPIIIVSGAGDIRDAISATRLGAWNFILKPLKDMSIVEHAIRKSLERRDLLTENRRYREHLEEEVATRTIELENRSNELEAANRRLTIEIEERKLAEHALRESEERFLQLAEHIDAVFWLGTLDCKTIIYVSPPYQEIFGRTCESLYADPKSFLEAIHPEDRDEVADGIFQPSPRGNEYRICLPSGEIKWIRTRAFPVDNVDGRPYRLAGISEDVTDQKMSEKRMVESEEKYRKLFSTGLDPIIIYDGDSLEVVDANRAALVLHGYEKEEFVGLSLFDLSAEKEESKAIIDEAVIKGGVTVPIRYHLKKDGAQFPVETAISHFRWLDKPMIFEIMRDISERMEKEKLLKDYNRNLEQKVDERTLSLKEKNFQLEEAMFKLKNMQEQLVMQEKLASLGGLVSGIAHEIKNPLNFINNFAKMSLNHFKKLQKIVKLEEENLSDISKERLEQLLFFLTQNMEKIGEHGKKTDNIIKGMLLHSREVTSAKTPTNINDLLDEYVDLADFGHRGQGRVTAVRVVKEYQELESIRVVPQDLGRVFLNLLNNAYYSATDKARDADDGFEAEIHLTTRDLEDSVEVLIRDNGRGIPSGIATKIFEPFFTTKPANEGTGLGLSISYDIITKTHAGEMSFNTVEGQFAEFLIALPK